MYEKKLTLRVLDDARNLALHNGNGGVGGTQIDTDHGTSDLAIAGSRLIASELRWERGTGESSRSSGEGGGSGKLECNGQKARGLRREALATYSSRQARSQHDYGYGV